MNKTYKVTKIKATSRAAIKIRDNFYTLEATEEREILDDSDMQGQWDLIFDSVNGIVDYQVEDVVKQLTANKKK